MSPFYGVVLLVSAVVAAPHIPSAPDACSLITKEDAAAALGEAATGPKVIKEMSDGAGGTVSACEYTGSGYNRVQLNLTHIPKTSAAMYLAMCKEKTSKDLSGLGEMACWYNEKHEELHAFKGLAFVSIELRRKGDPTEAIKALMKKAVDRLK